MNLHEHVRAAEKLLSQASYSVSQEDLTPVLPGRGPATSNIGRYTHSQLISRAAVHARLALALAQKPHEYSIDIGPVHTTKKED